MGRRRQFKQPHPLVYLSFSGHARLCPECLPIQEMPGGGSNVVSFSSMAIQDRTLEFRTCVDSIRKRSAVQPRTAERLHGKSDFSRMASAIAKDISSTTIKLGKLAQRRRLRAQPRTV